MFIQLHTWLVSETIFNWRVSLCNWTNDKFLAKCGLNLKSEIAGDFTKLNYKEQSNHVLNFRSLIGNISHRVHIEWQWPLSGVYSIMMEKSAQPGAGGGCTPTPFHSIYLPSRTKLQCTLQLRGQMHPHYFYSTPICTLRCLLITINSDYLSLVLVNTFDCWEKT